MADDEPDVLAIMAKKISGNGYVAITAKDGQDAWEKIQLEVPDMVLLDLNMPKMGGFDVLRELRKYPPEKKWIPVIIISTRGELHDIQKGIAMEAEHYITKPCSMDDVLKSVRLIEKLIPGHKTLAEIENDNREMNK